MSSERQPGAGVAVVVPTRNRPDTCPATILSLVEARPAGCELVVVDQSDDDATMQALAAQDLLKQIRYVRSKGRGASAARNEGIQLTDAELLLFTDDDCVVAPDWVTAWRTAMEAVPAVEIAFGTVRSPGDDGGGEGGQDQATGIRFTSEAGRGYLSVFTPRPGNHGLEIFRSGPSALGMGASMALRRAAWVRTGGFDEGLGPGTALGCGEELDLAYRVAIAGGRVGHMTAPVVWHHGFRSGEAAARQIASYISGTAALYVKHVRCGDRFVSRLLVVETWRFTRTAAGRMARRSRPLGLRNLLSHTRGMMLSSRRPLDRARRLYLPEVRSAAARGEAITAPTGIQ